MKAPVSMIQVWPELRCSLSQEIFKVKEPFYNECTNCHENQIWCKVSILHAWYLQLRLYTKMVKIWQWPLLALDEFLEPGTKHGSPLRWACAGQKRTWMLQNPRHPSEIFCPVGVFVSVVRRSVGAQALQPAKTGQPTLQPMSARLSPPMQIKQALNESRLRPSLSWKAALAVDMDVFQLPLGMSPKKVSELFQSTERKLFRHLPGEMTKSCVHLARLSAQTLPSEMFPFQYLQPFPLSETEIVQKWWHCQKIFLPYWHPPAVGCWIWRLCSSYFLLQHFLMNLCGQPQALLCRDISAVRHIMPTPVTAAACHSFTASGCGFDYSKIFKTWSKPQAWTWLLFASAQPDEDNDSMMWKSAD